MSTTSMDCRFSFDIQAIPEVEWIAMKQFRQLKRCGSRETLRLWMKFGLVGRSGGRVQLPNFRVGGRRYTTIAAFNWWNQELDR